MVNGFSFSVASHSAPSLIPPRSRRLLVGRVKNKKESVWMGMLTGEVDGGIEQ